MLALGDDVHEAGNVESIGAQRVRCHLPVQDERGDVGVVGGDLPPALRAVLGGNAHEADEPGRKRLDLLDLHRGNFRELG